MFQQVEKSGREKVEEALRECQERGKKWLALTRKGEKITAEICDLMCEKCGE